MMTEKNDKESGPQNLLEAWMKSSTEIFGAAMKMWPDVSKDSGTEDSSKKGGRSRTMESWLSNLKALQALSSTMSEPGAMEGMVNGINTFPEILMKMVQPAMDGFFHLQKEWLEKAGRIGKSTAAYDFENLDQEAFRAWSEIYEKEFRQFLNIPQLGLTRFYQERASEATDKYNLFQATVAEFISLLYLPVEKSAKVMQDQITDLADQGKLPENIKDYYRLWIKTLEGHYMTLFKSPEYSEELRRTLNALGEFTVARQKLLEDALTFLPVPTHKDMDDFYKEIYMLKKRIRDLEKKSEDNGMDDYS
jgi:class III poly(R)-hydroxyalkanoic acid synthase PhaE subunit